MEGKDNYIEKLGKTLMTGIIAGIIFIIVFAMLAAGLLRNEITIFDSSVYNFINRFSSPSVTLAAVFITHMGSAITMAVICIAAAIYLAFVVRFKYEALMLLCNLLGAWFLNSSLKEIFKRTRPGIPHLVLVQGYSFPSGHAMVSAAFYSMLGYLLWLNLKKKKITCWYVPILVTVFITLIGASRIYLGVHYGSDVIAGFAAGGAWVIACIIGLHILKHRSKKT